MDNSVEEAQEQIEHLQDLAPSRFKIGVAVGILLVTAAATFAGVYAARSAGNVSDAQRSRQELSASAVSDGLHATALGVAADQQRDDSTEAGWRAALLRIEAGDSAAGVAGALRAQAAAADSQSSTAGAAVPLPHAPYRTYAAQIEVPTLLVQQSALSYAQQSAQWQAKGTAALSIVSVLALALFLLGLALTISHTLTQKGFVLLALIMLVVSTVRLGVIASGGIVHPTASCINGFAVGSARYAGGDNAGAITTLQRAVASCPSYADAWNALAVAEYSLKTKAGFQFSEHAFAKALALNETKPAVMYNNLGFTQLINGRLGDAAATLASALKLDPTNEYTLASLAEERLLNNDPAAADRYLQRAMHLVAGHGPAFRLAFFTALRTSQQAFRGLGPHNSLLVSYFTKFREAEASIDSRNSATPGDAHGAKVSNIIVRTEAGSLGTAGYATLGFAYTGLRTGDHLSLRWYKYDDIYELADSVPDLPVDAALAGAGTISPDRYFVPMPAGSQTLEIYLNGIILGSATFTMPAGTSG
jgi:tetratricopeptide (TPR) repeat protein